ncbi:hypothetical protein AB0H71_27230 [Nocardia sp. NPDC050697]|uniref:hypothetical protein n=1 Tax=Nocardia sp. NPDC050697 TaxID=3155158 RepID=UPI0033F14119
MEHVEDGAESIGAMLSDIAESLREVSRKLDLVAARVDVPLPVPVPADDRDVATRLATIEAWAFRTDRDVADLGRRLDTLQSVADAPGTGRRHAAEPGPGAAAEAPSGGRRAAEDGAGFRVAEAARPGRRAADESAGHRAADADDPASRPGAAPTGRRRVEDLDTGAVGQQATEPTRRGRRAAADAEAGEQAGPPARLGRRAAEDSTPLPGETSGPGAERPVEEGRSAVPPRRRAAERDPLRAELGSGARDDSDNTEGLGRRFADEGPAMNGQAPATGRRSADRNGSAEVGPHPASAHLPESNGAAPAPAPEAPRRRAAEHDEPARAAEDTAEGHRTAADSATERPASAYGPSARGPQPGATPELPAETAAPRVPRPRYAAGSSRQRIAEARAESASRLSAEQGETGTADREARPAPADQGVRPAPVRRVENPAETAVSARLSGDPGGTPAVHSLPARLATPDEPEPSTDDEPAGPNLRAAVEARRASGRLPQRGTAPSPTPPGATPNQTTPSPERTELTRPDEPERWSGPRRNGSSLGLGETVAAAYDQGLRDGFTGQQDGYRQAPAAGYPLDETGDDFAPFADRQTPDAHTEQVGRPGLTSGAAERPGSAEPAVDRSAYADFGNGFTGATAEETAHADKVQAMLDELKRTAAAMPFGPPTGEPDPR